MALFVVAVNDAYSEIFTHQSERDVLIEVTNCIFATFSKKKNRCKILYYCQESELFLTILKKFLKTKISFMII